MNLTRGFRRLVIVTSGVLLILGAAEDALLMPSLPTEIYVVLTDGRQVTLDHMPDRRSGLTERQVLAMALSELPDSVVPPLRRVEDLRPPDRFVPDKIQAEDIREVTVAKRGVVQWVTWWWVHAQFLLFAVGLTIVLWVGFLAALWVARGFA